MSDMALNQLQSEVSEWTKRNFGDTPAYQPLLGIVEEVGELSHHHLKSEQGIRGSREYHRAEIVGAVGDIVVFLAHYCNCQEIDLSAAVANTWAEVRTRNWTKKEDGSNSKSVYKRAQEYFDVGVARQEDYKIVSPGDRVGGEE